MTNPFHRILSRGVRTSSLALATLLLGGCASSPAWLPSAGPDQRQVVAAPQDQETPGIRLVDVSDAVAKRLLASEKHHLFSELPDSGRVTGYTVGAGDVVEVAVWEAPPATLFGSMLMEPRGGTQTSGVTTFPDQMVSADGTIKVPFAGAIPVVGKTPQQIEAEVVKRLTGKANQPQVLVRVVRNNTANVTVVGEVVNSQRMPLTAKGERLLDALAAAGGVRQPVGKMTVQLTRGESVQTMPLDRIIQDPRQNIVLRPGDVVTALFQPLSFTVLGASGKNDELPFEANGLTLAQALARAGGLQDARADAQGVFIFRFEDLASLAEADRGGALTPDGKAPVVYRVDLKDPRSFFVAQGFPMRNKDVVYIANASGAELQKFLNILTSSLFSVSSLVNLGR